jgi:hypothetical protein
LILPSILKQPGYRVAPTAAAILLAAQLFCQAAKMAVSGLLQHDLAGQCAGTSDLGERDGGDLGRPPLFPNGSRRLPACQTILNAIGNLLAGGCQVEEFLFADISVFSASCR